MKNFDDKAVEEIKVRAYQERERRRLEVSEVNLTNQSANVHLSLEKDVRYCMSIRTTARD